MMKIHLLDHRSEIFQTFSDTNQLFNFLSRQTRFQKGKTLVVRNENRVRILDLGDESANEINKLVVQLANEIKA